MPTYKHSNRLIHEKSPYLLQHSHNPVDWYPWCDEAFEKAKAEDKPVFLSIGYSTCHWCHVMAHESFEDEEVAQILNENYISIKVDREERPDIDSIYMEACQAMTGSGGWPLTVIMTPDKKPFFAGTYFPKQDRYSMPGLMTLLNTISEKWKKDKKALEKMADTVVAHIKEGNEDNVGDIRDILGENVKEAIEEDIFHSALNLFIMSFDSTFGGFGPAPKFPTPHNLIFLLRYNHVYNESKALEMTEKTLTSMYMGGIFDHVGYGFSRYSTDHKWHVPHFEKMLYDNALLAIAYTEAYHKTKKPLYAQVARKIFTYVLRDLKSPDGGFFSAEDADSEGEEGKFYLWTREDIIRTVGKEKAEIFFKYYNLTGFGNLYMLNIPREKDAELIESIKNELFKSRGERIRPHRDDKILTSWNGLMIAALAFGGRVLKIPEYIIEAERAVDFIYKHLFNINGRLLARYRDGEADILAYAEDYAFLTWGLLELYEATYKTDYLSKALSLSEDLLKYFEDEKDGGLFLYGNDAEQLIVRPKEIYDGAMPSANSVALQNFIRLNRLTGKIEFENAASRIVNCFYNSILDYPRNHSFFLASLMHMTVPSREIVIVTDDAYNGDYRKFYDEKEKNPELFKMIQNFNEKYDPFSVSLLIAPGTKIEEFVPMAASYRAIDGKTTAYICSNFSCQEPMTLE